jgi:hypothetical protein
MTTPISGGSTPDQPEPYQSEPYQPEPYRPVPYPPATYPPMSPEPLDPTTGEPAVAQPVDPASQVVARPVDSVPPVGAVTTAAPPIAPGPGVVPPFASPPREGHGRRLGIGIAIGAVVFVLCCGGGIAGFGALVVTQAHQRVDDARTVVTSYMNDWRKQDYPAAYQLLCSDEKDQVSIDEFTNDIDQDTVVEFTVADPQAQSDAIAVPVHVTFDDGSAADPLFKVVVDSDGNSRICGQA